MQLQFVKQEHRTRNVEEEELKKKFKLSIATKLVREIISNVKNYFGILV